MPESSATAQAALERWSAFLTDMIAESPTGWTDPADQLAIENAIAAGIAELAGEPAPVAATALSSRPILLKDILITTDLVRRALANPPS